jgi:hypothetical protein
MDIVRSIDKLGFRRWYERQLIEGHGYLITCFLCMITVAATLESFASREALSGRIAMAVTAFFAGAVGYFAWVRYRAIMLRAEWLGDHATCPQCRVYGRFRIVDTHSRRVPRVDVESAPFPPDEAPLLGVQCKKCGHRWTI